MTAGFEGDALFFGGRVGTRLLLVGAIHHTQSPAGPFTELVAWRPGLRRTTLAVGARLGALSGGGEGSERATLKWFADGNWRELHWEERGLRLRAQARRSGVRVRLPLRLVLSDGAHGKARVPGRLSVVRLEVEVPAGDPLAALSGRHRGILFSSARLAGEPWLARPVRAEPAAEPS